MDYLLNWVLRVAFIALGAGAGIWIFHWLRANWGTATERWTVRIAAGMVVLAGLYTVAHARLLAQRAEIEEGRERYAVFGDPRRTELRRGEVRGWMLDCTGRDEQALAFYREQDGSIDRLYPLGEAGANFLGGGTAADERDFTIEVLFSEQLREPRSLRELGEPHPAGRDLALTLCRDATAVAHRNLVQAGRPGAVVVQDVRTGAILAYAATGGPEDPPVGIKHYSPPGSVFKLALSALWWENDLPDDIEVPCPGEIQVSERATISNFGDIVRGTVIGPTGMLIPSCNTAAVWMALEMRRQIGSEPFVEAYERYGFITYPDEPPTDTTGGFWRTSSREWEERMTPPPSRVRISEETGDDEWAQLAIGQGPVDVTVVGISRFIQAIGNDGVMLPPTFEMELGADPPRGERVMSEEVARKLQAAMQRVVQEGTGRSALPAVQGTGWRLGGKTGTAQVAGQADNGWFAGLLFDSSGNARFSVVAFLDGGGSGSGGPTSIAAAVARELATNEPPLLAAPR